MHDALFERMARITWDPSYRAPTLELNEDDPLFLIAGAVDVLGEDVAEMLHERQRHVEDLAERDSVLRSTLADLAHDVRTPLASLKLGLDGLRSGRAFEDVGPVLRAEVEHLEVLFQNLSTLMHLGASRSLMARTSTDMVALCERVVLRFEVLSRDRGVKLECGVGAPSLWLLVDPLAVEQAVGNVVQNAVKYAKGKVAVLLLHEEDSVVLRVDDDGEGMAGLDIPSLTHRHIRGQRSLDATRDGAGLGLAITKAIMEEHGASIHLSDTEGGGARVQLGFPRTLMVAPSELGSEGGATS